MRLDTEIPSKKTKCKQENDDQPTTGLDLLPREIALDILSRLPISSLLQLRFSCRSWQILSQDPHLPRLQFSRTAKKNPCLIFHCEYPLRNQLHFVEFSDQDQENGIVRKIQTPFCSVMPEFNVIASCNGLLCLSDSLYSDPIYVYNPFTRENRELPKSRQFDDQEVVFGFGFHPVTNEYKVVKIIHHWNGYRRFRFCDHTQSEVQVLSLNTNNWRSIGKVPYPLDPRSAEALVNGRLHWLTQPRRCPGVRHSRSIVSFDLADEQFREIPRPDCGSLNRTNYHLAALGGCLSAIVCCHYEKFEIWVMKDYDVKESWIKEFKIKDYSLQFMKPHEKLSKKSKCKMEDDQPRSGMESIQHDLALDIFSRLPITSLLQFSFVSRFWQMLSYDPHLAALHFSRTAKTNPYLIFHCDYPIRNQLCFAELSDQTDNEIVRRIQTPFHDTMPEFKVIASCNGLLCLSDSLYGDPLYMYNPFTREYKELPKSRQYDDQEVVFGFGFHPVTNEYKVVKTVLFWNQYNMLPHPRPRPHPRHRRLRIDDHTGSEVQVYSLGSTNWRSIGKVPYLLEQRASEALVDGRLHWLTHPRLYLGARIHRSRSIVSFDLADEQFREVPRPECGSLNRTNYHLAVLGGCLSAVVCDKHIKKIKCKLDDDEPRNGMESLQPDIALDICSRLPITSLLQFSSVNRSWQMLQYDPHLASLHFSRTAKNNPCLIFHCDYPIRNQLFFVELSDEMDNEIVRRIQTPFSDTMPEFNVIASCKGLLCLSDSLYSDPLYIYNPFTRKHKELPKSRQFDDQEVVFGFGFHPVTNEYKVVKIVLYWNQYNVFPRQRPRGHRIHDHTRSEVQVCSLGNTNWRSIGKVPYRLEQRASEALVCGRLHWLAQLRICRGTRIHRDVAIVSFDLADEQFQEVPRPDCGNLIMAN
ncbi:hypothetical protein TEA_028562 [Camellia sinensis var. sinensis]|uniref:F-box domain-containing protein n=1 Tax=Camellia sinensis var. sinensis TaxID=542762 RepID=A0A4S4EUI8_CAMSN|nr:hypothetical protein TEA_028562 [Camellia sinensis var. sinensis]